MEAKRDKKAEAQGRLHVAELHAEPQLEHKRSVETKNSNKELKDLPTLPDQVKETNRNDAIFTKVREYLANPETYNRPNVYLWGTRAKDKLLYRDSKLWVTKGLRLDMIQEIHDQPAIGHTGVRKTIQLLQQHFFWPKMKKNVDQYIQNCHMCKQAKAPRDRYNGTLNPLPVPQRPWMDITMDFVTGLPKCELKNAILMVVDRLTKERVYIPCLDKNEETNAEATAKMLLHNVWRKHSLPTSVLSD